MDDDRQVENVCQAVRHDRWSIAVLALNWATQVACATADTIENFTIAAMQHGTQVKYDKKFNEIVRKL